MKGAEIEDARYTPPEWGSYASIVSRIAFVVFAAGIAVLAISLTMWVLKGPHKLYYTTHTYNWVDARQSDKPAVESDEIWHATAQCLRPHFQNQVELAQARLQAHLQSRPQNIARAQRKPTAELEELRERFRHEHIAIDSVVKHLGSPVTMEEYESIKQAARGNESFNASNWFPEQVSLAIQAKRWRTQLDGVTDQEMLLSEAVNAKKNFSPLKMEMRVLDAKTPEEVVAIASKNLLKLSSFTDTEAEAIRFACVTMIPIKRIVAATSYHSEVGRWPAEHATAFWAGLSLLFIGLLLAPVVRWVGASKT